MYEFIGLRKRILFLFTCRAKPCAEFISVLIQHHGSPLERINNLVIFIRFCFNTSRGKKAISYHLLKAV